MTTESYARREFRKHCSMATETELRQQLADVCRVLFRLGLVDYMGHPSARIPGTDRVLMKPRHSTRIKSQDRITPEDMIVIDLQGNVLEGKDGPPGEALHPHLHVPRSAGDPGRGPHPPAFVERL